MYTYGVHPCQYSRTSLSAPSHTASFTFPWAALFSFCYTLSEAMSAVFHTLCSELCPTDFFPLLQAYPVQQGAYAFPVRALCIGWCVHSMCTYPDDARCLLCPIHVIRAYISPTLCLHSFIQSIPGTLQRNYWLWRCRNLWICYYPTFSAGIRRWCSSFPRLKATSS